MNETTQKAVAAYGGRELWINSKRITAAVSVHGLAFTLKRRPFFKRATISMEIARPFSRLTPIGKAPGITGVLDGHNVWLEGPDGAIINERQNARQYFPGGRRLFYWDDLDMAYFANYAFWNYFTLPALLLREDITWREIEPGRLEALFPPEIPTHSPVQQFRFDGQTGLLIQHDYTADIISRLAKAANVALAHVQNNNAVYASSRIVTPRSPAGNPLRGPTLISITVHNFCLE